MHMWKLSLVILSHGLLMLVLVKDNFLSIYGQFLWVICCMSLLQTVLSQPMNCYILPEICHHCLFLLCRIFSVIPLVHGTTMVSFAYIFIYLYIYIWHHIFPPLCKIMPHFFMSWNSSYTVIFTSLLLIHFYLREWGVVEKDQYNL